MATEGLPEGWAAYQDEQGRTFYSNAGTGATQWERPEMAPAAAALPDGWAAHLDAEGRTFYHNAATGETSWAAPAAAPAALAPAVTYTWSTTQAYDLGGREQKYTWDQRVGCLDESYYSSVATTIDQLNAGSVAGVEAGYIVMFSGRKQSYYVLWRDDTEAEARLAANVPAEQAKLPWSIAQCSIIGPLGSEAMFHGKAEMLDHTIWNSVQQTVDALNAGQISAAHGFCVIYSASTAQYHLIWQDDRQDLALATCGLSGCIPVGG